MTRTDEWPQTVRALDPIDVAAMPSPYGLINDLRERCPVGHSDTHGGFWNLFAYSDVCAAAVNAHAFSSRDVTIPSENLPVPTPPVMSDPPIHMQYRRPFIKRFAPAAVASLEPVIRAKITELIDGFIQRGEADLSSELFIPFPAFAALTILGLPQEDFAKFSRWARLAFTLPGEDDADHDWGAEVMEYFSPLYDRLADSDDDDIPTIARHLEIGNRPIERMEFVMLLMTFVNAGLDTTTNSSANIVLLLDERPDLRARLIDDFSLIPSAIEEFLRYLTPLPMLSRVTTRQVEVGEPSNRVTIAKDEKVALHWLAANHDPQAFPNAEEVVLDRSPNHHVAFGKGPHLCIGMHLARLQLRIVVEELLRRIPDYRVVHDEVVRAGGVTRQIQRLPVRFTEGPRLGTVS
jgi:cytochrome P450